MGRSSEYGYAAPSEGTSFFFMDIAIKSFPESAVNVGRVMMYKTLVTDGTLPYLATTMFHGPHNVPAINQINSFMDGKLKDWHKEINLSAKEYTLHMLLEEVPSFVKDVLRVIKPAHTEFKRSNWINQGVQRKGS